MKTLHLKQRPVLLIGSILVMAAILLSILAAPALAAQDSPPTGPGQGLRLELGLKRAQVILTNMRGWLGFGQDIVEAVETRIDAQKAQGRDTTSLETALANFQAALEQARDTLDEAEATLNQKAGFDDQGKVVDREQAIETLRSAADSFREARQTVRQALVDLRRAMREYLQQNRPR